MGNLYKTSAISPQDYMYQLPAEMMLKVLDFNEGQIDDIYNKSDLFNKSLLSIKSLTPDTEDVNRIQKDYGSKIDAMTKELSKDATQWRKYRQPIKDLGREIEQDFTSGEIGQIQKNYTLAQEYDKILAEAVKDKRISPMTARIYKAKALEDFSKTGFDRKTNSGKSFNGITPMSDIDLNERIGKYVDKALADENAVYNSTIGKWFITDSKNETKELTEEKLLASILPKIMGDTELQGYLNERSQVGMLKGIFGENGNLDIFKLVDRMQDGVPMKDAEGNILQSINYSQNPLAKAVQGTINERKYFSSKRGVTGNSANPYTTQAINHQNQWSLQKDRQAYEDKVRTHEEEIKLVEKAEAAKKSEMETAIKLSQQFRLAGNTKEADRILNEISGRYPIVITRPEEKSFSPNELKNLATEYTNLMNNPTVMGSNSEARLAELDKIFGGAAKRLNLEDIEIDGVKYTGYQRYADALAFASGDRKNFYDKPQVTDIKDFNKGGEQTATIGQKVNRDAHGSITFMNKRGVEAQRLAEQIAKNSKSNSTSVNGVFEELSKSVKQSGQPELSLDPNTKIGSVGLNLMDALLPNKPFNIYLGDVAHADAKGNSKPSNAIVKDIISQSIKGGKKPSEFMTEVSYKMEGNKGVYRGKIKDADGELQDVKIVVDGATESMLPYITDPKFLELPGAKEFAMYSDPYMYSLGSQIRSRMPYVDMGVEQKIEVGGKPKYTIRQREDGGYEVETDNTIYEDYKKQKITKENIPAMIRQLELEK